MPTPTANLLLNKYADDEYPWGPGLDANWDVLDAVAPVSGLAVVKAENPSTTLRVAINGGVAIATDNSRLSYAGSVLTLSASTTTRIWLDNAGALQHGSAYPASTTAQARLATVTTGTGTTAGTFVTAIQDDRATVAVIAQSPPDTEPANTVFAGPTSGADAVPAFRLLVAADIPALDASKITTGLLPLARGGTGAGTQAAAANAILPAQASNAGKFLTTDGTNASWSSAVGSGTVTSISCTAPSTVIAVSGVPITGSGTIALSFVNQSANLVWAGPSSGGAGAPAFRSLVAADLPNTSVTPGSYTAANITVDAQGRITAAANGGGGGGSGTVTSVAMTVPTSVLAVAGTPITGSGTLAVTLQTQSANLVWAGPTSGAAATPTFRSLVAADAPVVAYDLTQSDATPTPGTLAQLAAVSFRMLESTSSSGWYVTLPVGPPQGTIVYLKRDTSAGSQIAVRGNTTATVKIDGFNYLKLDSQYDGAGLVYYGGHWSVLYRYGGASLTNTLGSPPF